MNGIFSLEGQCALVTGAAKGIGRALALGLARQGAHVAVTDLDGAVEETAAEVAELGQKAMAMICDVSCEAEVRELVARTTARLGRIDILVNNAGINLKAPAIEQTMENIQAVINVNLLGTFFCSKAVAPGMLSRRCGSIVNLSSIAGLAALGRGNNFYGATKAAIIGLTRELSAEWAPHGVRVNAIAPGWIETDRVSSYLDTQPGLRERMQSAAPMGRLGSAEELIGPVVFLASNASSLVTGHVLVVDGGLLSSVRL